MLAATGETTASLDQHRLALGVMQALAVTAPDDPANLRQLGVAHHKVGNSLGNPNYPNMGDHAGRAGRDAAVGRGVRTRARRAIPTTRCSNATWPSPAATPPTS